MKELMTNEEILDYLAGWIDSVCDKDNMFLIDEIKLEALSTAHEAVKKQIPAKVKKGKCPSCGLFFDDDDYDLNVEHIKHCMECGQALDWSE